MNLLSFAKTKTEFLTSDQEAFFINFEKSKEKKEGLYGLFGSAGTGKSLPLDEPVLTMNGFVKNETLQVGNYVINDSGTESEIMKIFRQSDLEMYKVTFSDGSSTQCCIDHLWKVKKNNDNFKILSLYSFADDILENQYYIPLVRPIKFKEDMFNIDPYTAGRNSTNGSYPSKKYLYCSDRQRTAFLCGMLSKNSKESLSIFYSEYSYVIDWFVWMVRSLGGVATNEKHSSSFKLPFNPYRGLKYLPMDKKQKQIIKVEYIGLMDGQCIQLADNSSHLYITRDFTVTHNTFSLSIIHDYFNCYLTAPTNKAVRVLTSKIKTDKYSTIHSYSGCSVYRDGTEKKLRTSNISASKREDMKSDVLIVDECSMMSEFLLTQTNKITSHTSILFAGDPCQLPPPLSGTCSPSFTNVDGATILEEIVRQQKGNKIIEFATDIRNSLANPEIKFSPTSGTNESGKGVYYGKSIENYLHGYDDYLDNPDFVRFLCWTNKKSRYANDVIRKYLFGATSQDNYILKNDLLVAGELIYKKEIYDSAEKLDISNSVWVNSDEFIVLEIIDKLELDIRAEEHSLLNLGFSRLKLILAKVKNIVSGEVRDIYICNDSDIDFILKKLVQVAKSRRSVWQLYYKVESLNGLSHAYSSTIHKSQGSTFKNVIVDLNDVNKNKKRAERLQLLYVAVTRPEDTCTLLV